MTSTRLQARAFSEIVKRGSRLLGRTGPRLVRLGDVELMEEAQRRTGLSDFGAPDFREALRRFLQACDTEGQLTLLGRIAVRQDTLRLLANRLKIQQDRQRNPAIGAEVIQRPLFVTGLPRTGTTLLHGLLAQDPANRVPLNWELMFPSPPPDRHTYTHDRRIELADRQIRWFHRLAPDFPKIHPVAARLAEECVIITSHTFLSFQFQTTYDLPSYQSWLEASDLRPCYEMHKQFLQHLQWRGPRGQWVLKAPPHVFGLEALFAVYPDAGVIFTHRDPLEVVPSVASLHTVLRSTFSDAVNPRAVGAELTRRWADGITRGLRSRDAGCAPADRFCDVRYADLVSNPLDTARRIYQHFGMSLSMTAGERMRRFLAEHPKDKHGRHEYSLAQFGFSAEEERERYRAYRERFGF
jgi:hypothetical protein